VGLAPRLLKKMRNFVADLHIHTCLSPCAELDMTPLRIARKAAEKGLDIIAVSDHNSAENALASIRAGREAGVAVLPAMEVTSSEEAHVLALFGVAEAALEFQRLVYSSITEGAGKGGQNQVVVNERDEVMGFCDRLLIGATSMKLGEIIDAVHGLGGIAVASHVDREAFSVSSQMGFVPAELGFDAFEIIDREKADAALTFHRSAPRIRSSDAHYLADIGRRTTSFVMESPSFREIALALAGEGGRSVCIPE